MKTNTYYCKNYLNYQEKIYLKSIYGESNKDIIVDLVMPLYIDTIIL